MCKNNSFYIHHSFSDIIQFKDMKFPHNQMNWISRAGYAKFYFGTSELNYSLFKLWFFFLCTEPLSLWPQNQTYILLKLSERFKINNSRNILFVYLWDTKFGKKSLHCSRRHIFSSRYFSLLGWVNVNAVLGEVSCH